MLVSVSVVEKYGFCDVRGVSTAPSNSRYPDTIAVCYSSVDNKVTCVYNDHSLYVWDVTDIKKVGKARSFLFHSGAVWGVDVSCPLFLMCIMLAHNPVVFVVVSWLQCIFTVFELGTRAKQ